jgi:hypothetical protein
MFQLILIFYHVLIMFICQKLMFRFYKVRFKVNKFNLQWPWKELGL